MKKLIARFSKKTQSNELKGYNIKHLVMNIDDLKYLSSEEEGQLLGLLEKIEKGRRDSNKPTQIHIVIDSEKSYSGKIIEILKQNGDF